jgi:adenylate cyclase class IV
MIEIELRGRLTGAGRKKALAYCRKNGKLLGEFKQIAIFCDTQNEQLGSFYDPKVRIALQLSYDIQNKKKALQLKAKNGHWANVGREELILKLEPEALHQAYQLLRTFGISKGCPRFYHRIDYRFGNIIVSLKDGGLAPDHWEAEISTTKQNEKKSHQKLQKFLKKLNLIPWSETEYKDIVNKVYRENPAVEFSKIDVSPVWKKR